MGARWNNVRALSRIVTSERKRGHTNSAGEIRELLELSYHLLELWKACKIACITFVTSIIVFDGAFTKHLCSREISTVMTTSPLTLEAYVDDVKKKKALWESTGKLLQRELFSQCVVSIYSFGVIISTWASRLLSHAFLATTNLISLLTSPTLCVWHNLRK